MWVSLGIVTFSSTFPLFLFYCFRSIFSERRCEARRRISGCGWVVFFGSLFLADRLFPRTAQIHFSQAGIVSNLPFFFFFISPPPPSLGGRLVGRRPRLARHVCVGQRSCHEHVREGGRRYRYCYSSDTEREERKRERDTEYFERVG